MIELPASSITPQEQSNVESYFEHKKEGFRFLLQKGVIIGNECYLDNR